MLVKAYAEDATATMRNTQNRNILNSIHDTWLSESNRYRIVRRLSSMIGFQYIKKYAKHHNPNVKPYITWSREWTPRMSREIAMATAPERRIMKDISLRNTVWQSQED